MSGKTEFGKFMDRTPRLRNDYRIAKWDISKWSVQTLMEMLEDLSPSENDYGLRLKDTYVTINEFNLELDVYAFYEETDQDHLNRCKQLWHKEKERLEKLSKAIAEEHQKHLELIKETQLKQLKALAKKYDVKIDHGV